jgi:hypothetical protein
MKWPKKIQRFKARLNPWALSRARHARYVKGYERMIRRGESLADEFDAEGYHAKAAQLRLVLTVHKSRLALNQ